MLEASLEAALEHDFFRWFGLQRYEPPQSLAGGGVWHGFRPDGAAFRDFVTVNLETDGTGRIADAKLCLDRAFIGHPQHGAFARDIAASFLRWSLGGAEQEQLRDFLAELGDLGPNVIRLARAPVPQPPGPTTDLYRVFLGETKDAARALPGKTLRLVNLQARDGPRDPQHDWIWIQLRLRAEHGSLTP
jgi:hypothetical protein